MNRSSLLAAAGLTLVFATVAPALAANTFYTDRPTFEGLLGSFTKDTFESALGYPAPTAPVSALIGGAATISSTGGPGFLYSLNTDTLPTTGLGGSSGNPAILDAFQALTISFINPIHAVGFSDLDLTGGNSEVAHLIVHFDGGLPDQEYTNTASVALAPTFMGVISNDNIRSITVFSAEFGVTTAGGRANLIDDLTFAAEVPAPASILLLSSLTLIGRRSRR